MFIQANACPIWGPGEGRPDHQGYPMYIEEAHRAGGQYMVDIDALMELQNDPKVRDDPQVKARLTTMLVDEREQGVKVPTVTPEHIQEAKKAAPLPVPKRAERLLRYLVKCSEGFTGCIIRMRDASSLAYKEAMAWSESTSGSEIAFFSGYLSKNGWVEIVEIPNTLGDGAIVTVDGYARIESLKTNPDSAQAFVAMWIDDEMNDAYKKGIEPAIVQAGYKPMRIDRKADANKLDDDIVAEIRRSRFLVSDMTHGKDGVRGSVYFEAGFAMGLNIPIIYTCRSDLIDKVHFDTRQYAYILWKTPEELREGLMGRIRSRIGEGPNGT